MTWLLVLYFYSGGTAVHGEYRTQQECLYHAYRIQSNDRDVSRVRCVRKEPP